MNEQTKKLYAMAKDLAEKKEWSSCSQAYAVLRDADGHPGLWPYIVGERYLVLSCTHFWSGVCVGGDDKFILLEDATWVPDASRLKVALETSTCADTEDIPGVVIISKLAIVSSHPLAKKPVVGR